LNSPRGPNDQGHLLQKLSAVGLFELEENYEIQSHPQKI